MAETEPKIILERSYVVPLRRQYLKSPLHKRTQKAVSVLKQFLMKHMKGTEVKLGKRLNEEMWKHGMKNPPHHIKVTATKDEKGIIRTELFGFKYEEKKKEKKVEKSKLEEMKERVFGKGDENAKKEVESKNEVIRDSEKKEDIHKPEMKTGNEKKEERKNQQMKKESKKEKNK